jgi:hypothetical protein
MKAPFESALKTPELDSVNLKELVLFNRERRQRTLFKILEALVFSK